MSRFSKLETETPEQPRPVEKPVVEREASGIEALTPEESVRRGDELFYLGEFPKALRHYSRALQEHSTEVRPWAGQILCLLLQDQVREATAWAKRAVETFPDIPTVVALQGLAFARQGMHKRGLGTSDYAMSLKNADALAWVARGWILLEADNRNWQSCFDKAQEQAHGADWRLEILMGFVLESYRKWVHAVSHYEKAAGHQTSNYYLWHRLGHCYGKLGVRGKAIEAQRHALELKPAYQPAEKELRRYGGLPIGGFFARIGRLFGRGR
ncbi:tetratricopeptide repeat protein [bacterium]|nr:tetratricopeptide repeat protein [bacterium]